MNTERIRILRIAVTQTEAGRYPSAARIAELAGCHEATVRRILREALDRASRLVPLSALAIAPDSEGDGDGDPGKRSMV